MQQAEELTTLCARSSLSPPRVAQLVFKSPLLSLMTIPERGSGDVGHPDMPEKPQCASCK